MKTVRVLKESKTPETLLLIIFGLVVSKNICLARKGCLCFLPFVKGYCSLGRSIFSLSRKYQSKGLISTVSLFRLEMNLFDLFKFRKYSLLIKLLGNLVPCGNKGALIGNTVIIFCKLKWVWIATNQVGVNVQSIRPDRDLSGAILWFWSQHSWPSYHAIFCS